MNPVDVKPETFIDLDAELNTKKLIQKPKAQIHWFTMSVPVLLYQWIFPQILEVSSKTSERK